jgi:hypothetical protein
VVVIRRSAALFNKGLFMEIKSVVVNMFVVVFCLYFGTECENFQ